MRPRGVVSTPAHACRRNRFSCLARVTSVVHIQASVVLCFVLQQGEIFSGDRNADDQAVRLKHVRGNGGSLGKFLSQGIDVDLRGAQR